MSLLPSQTPSVIPFALNKYMNIYSLAVSNSATAPDTKVEVGTGICRDSTDVYDMINAAAVTIDCEVNGLNGLDTGSLGASKVYYVHLVSDPVHGNTTGAMLSLSATNPVMPSNYSAFRVIGYMMTDSSSDLLLCYNSGNENARVFKYDAPQATAVTAGAATSYTAVALTALVPPVENLEVSIAYALTPSAASQTLKMTPGNATGDAVTITGQVASVVVSGNANVLSKVTSAVPEIDYKVSNAAAAVAISVAGFNYYL
jgi:hypothetical protein